MILGIVNSIMLVGTMHADKTNSTTTATTGTNDVTKLPEMVVRGQDDTGSYKADSVSSPKYDGPLRDIPQTITVVPKSVIKDQGATTLRDVLRNVPGISMQAGEGGGGLAGDNLSIRGFNARNDIYVDGVRDYGAYSRDPFNVEQVEVSKGPASAYGGRGSAGGSVNLMTKAPFETPSYDATAGLGTEDYKRFTADVNQPVDFLTNTAARLNVMWHDQDEPGRDVVENERWAVAPSITFGLGQPTQLTLSYMHMEQDNVPDYGIPWVPAGNTNAVLSKRINGVPKVDFENFYGLEDYDFEDIDVDVATMIFTHQFDDWATLRDIFRFTQARRNSAITAPRFADLDPGPATVSDTVINRQLQRREIENDIYLNATDVTFRFDTGPISHVLLTGIEFSREDQDNRNSAQTANQPQTDIFNPHSNDNPLGKMPKITGVPSVAQVDTVAIYIFDTIRIGEHWEFIGGGRWDHVDTYYKQSPLSFDTDENLYSWRGAVVFKPVEAGSIYFGAGNSYNPSLDGNTGIALSTNNVKLEAEETLSFELGAKWEFFEQRLLVTGAAFYTEKENARTPGVNPNDPPLVLDGVQYVRGFEAGLAGNITRAWKAWAGYTFMDSEVEESNNPAEVGEELANTPRHSFSFWTTYLFPYGIEIGGGVNYVGPRENNNTSTSRTAPDYYLFDGLIAYHVNDHVTIRLNGYNLADEEYVDRVGGGHFVPGAGRWAVMSADFDF